jgi:hypothetical protein
MSSTPMLIVSLNSISNELNEYVRNIISDIICIPFAIQRIIYHNDYMDDEKSDLQNVINNLIDHFVVLVSFVVNGISFYIYTLTGGKIFLKVVFK